MFAHDALSDLSKLLRHLEGKHARRARTRGENSEEAAAAADVEDERSDTDGGVAGRAVEATDTRVELPRTRGSAGRDISGLDTTRYGSYSQGSEHGNARREARDSAANGGSEGVVAPIVCYHWEVVLEEGGGPVTAA